MKKNTKSKLAKRRNLSWESRTNTGKMPDYHLSWLERGANNAKVTVFLEGKHIKESGSHECHKYGMTFYSGTKVDQNYGISLLYMRKGAEIYRGQSQAQLALIYLERIGVEKNTNKHALQNIGLHYEYDDGVIQDYGKALGYHRKSISAKNVAVYYNIDLLYYYGKGVDQNYTEALLWLAKAANSSPDLNELYVFLEDTSHETEDITKSPKRTYSLQPETIIYGEAHYYIGLMYNNGYGVDQDKERAQNYFKIA
ncbi:hypothetical protein K501DRAFT_276209 [Backusella circina FSU 941]|nr:hypothetical protein K501DRAFT_276209 [Backusella circina FSU 941]